MTVHERLVELGAAEHEISDAEALLARTAPLDRALVLTDEVVEAARAGDATLLASLLAPEVEPEPDEIVASDEARATDDGTRFTLEEVRRELNL